MDQGHTEVLGKIVVEKQDSVTKASSFLQDHVVPKQWDTGVATGEQALGIQKMFASPRESVPLPCRAP